MNMRILAMSGLVMILASACSKCGGPGTPTPPPGETAAPATQVLPTVSELITEDKQAGTGPGAKNGQTVTVHYVGTLMDGSKFDSSRDRDQPFSFVLGARQVIAGWDQGVKGMKKGGIRVLKIPGHLAYGEAGAGGGRIPPNATLVFEVQLLDLK